MTLIKGVVLDSDANVSIKYLVLYTYKEMRS